MKFLLRSFTLLLFAGLSMSVRAGIVTGSFLSSVPSPTLTLTPGQTYTVTATASVSAGGFGAQFNQIQLNPNVGSQFQIVGGTCNTTNLLASSESCTVDVRFIGNQPGSFSSVLQMSCQIFSFAGGYSVSCGNAAPGALATMAQFAGSGLAGAVDVMGRGGLTALTLALMALVSWVTLRRRR
jgi:hypothetical protein